jgi:hypothetical protein
MWQCLQVQPGQISVPLLDSRHRQPFDQFHGARQILRMDRDARLDGGRRDTVTSVGIRVAGCDQCQAGNQ